MKFLGFIIGAIVLGWYLTLPFTFSSWESKTLDGGVVYNRIKFIPGFSEDTWLMQQSHQGPDVPTTTWDRLAIVVDKTKNPHVSKFYQFAQGPLEMGHAHESVPFRAPCMSCHVSGPRGIRPQNAHLLLKIKIAMLNMRIKTYGQSISEPGQTTLAGAPFKREHHALKKPLALKSCISCHSDNAIRGPLTMDNIDTARFLVDIKQMPPWPFSISSEDHQALFMQ